MADKIYEMLWDCEYCSTPKLLGKTHRFCPNCGAPQNPARRYFPPEDQKVAVEDHRYFGADRHCPSCKNPMGAQVKFCGTCGSPMEGAGVVALKPDPAAAAPAPVAPPPAGRGKALWVGLGVGVLALILVFAFWTKPVVAVVAGHQWSREIQIEKFGPVRESAWCDEMPSGARNVSRRREVRSHRDVPDGQDCRTVKKDRGDGTYAETQDCVPKTRQEPVHDDKCEYSVDKWFRDRTEKTAGAGLTPEPYWPEVRLARTGECQGCQRQGARAESYAVTLTVDGKSHSCPLTQNLWAGMTPASRWKTELRGLTGGLLCDRLAPAD